MVNNDDHVFRWSEILDIGKPQLNGEHREIIDQMAEVQALNSHTLSKEALLAAFDELIRCTRKHFKDEEEHLEAIAYPKREAHKRLHNSLMKSLRKYRLELVNSVYGRFPSSVFDFFRTWMVSHIMMADKQYAEFEATLRRPSAEPRSR